jgi:hypothetical protein
MNPKPPIVPPEAVEFASKLAALAEEHGIQECSVQMRVSNRPGDSRWNGKLRMCYTGKDGRGRPCKNVWIELDSTLRLDVVSTPESCN